MHEANRCESRYSKKYVVTQVALNDGKAKAIADKHNLDNQ